MAVDEDWIALASRQPLGPLFVVTERFDPSCGERWRAHVAWSGLMQLTEVVSLDPMLCPTVVHERRDDDWAHVVHEHFMLDYFTDLDWLLRRCGGAAGRNLLGVFRNPPTRPQRPAGPHAFAFEGYDLVDVTGGASVLTNCSGFDRAFARSELTAHGLLPTLERAVEVQRALLELYPGESHSDCHVWALFRALSPA